MWKNNSILQITEIINFLGEFVVFDELTKVPLLGIFVRRVPPEYNPPTFELRAVK